MRAQGLIPRATELIKLGLSFFLAFAPLVLGVAVLFGGVYAVSSMACVNVYVRYHGCHTGHTVATEVR
jgi:hypothetical protein